MTQKKTLQEREKELRLLVATPAGLEAVQELASRYSAVSGRLKPAGRSAVTYILVHERDQGLISRDSLEISQASACVAVGQE